MLSWACSVPNQNYIRAATYERDLVKKFIREGALYATRTPGSRTPIDVIAILPDLRGKPFVGPVKVHMIQCKLGTSRAKRSEIDFLKFMREKGVDAYFMTSVRGRFHCKFQRLELEEVEENCIDNGLNDADLKRSDSHRRTDDERLVKCARHPRYQGRRRPRVRRGIVGCRCYKMFGDR